LNLNGEDNLVSETLKKQIDRFLLALGFSLMFGTIILGQNFRQTVGKAVGVLMSPVLSAFGQENFHLILLGMAAIIAIYSSLIQKYTIDWDLVRNTQERMKVFQKEFREAQLSQNTSMLKELEGRRNDMMEGQMEMSKKSSSPWLISVPFPFLFSCGLTTTLAVTDLPPWFFPSGANSCLLLMFLALSSTGFTGTLSPPSESASLLERH
jgi:uncharacterized membrane protein (DUF106 family)